MLKQFKHNALKQARNFDIINILPQYIDLYNQALESIRI